MSDRIFYIYILNYMNVFSTALWHKRYLSTHTYAHTGCITPPKAASMRITKSRKVPILANLQHTCIHTYIHTYIHIFLLTAHATVIGGLLRVTIQGHYLGGSLAGLPLLFTYFSRDIQYYFTSVHMYVRYVCMIFTTKTLG